MFDGSPEATNGLEQCGWSPKTGKFYQNVPEVDGPAMIRTRRSCGDQSQEHEGQDRFRSRSRPAPARKAWPSAQIIRS